MSSDKIQLKLQTNFRAQSSLSFDTRKATYLLWATVWYNRTIKNSITEVYLRNCIHLIWNDSGIRYFGGQDGDYMRCWQNCSSSDDEESQTCKTFGQTSALRYATPLPILHIPNFPCPLANICILIHLHYKCWHYFKQCIIFSFFKLSFVFSCCCCFFFQFCLSLFFIFLKVCSFICSYSL